MRIQVFDYDVLSGDEFLGQLQFSGEMALSELATARKYSLCQSGDKKLNRNGGEANIVRGRIGLVFRCTFPAVLRCLELCECCEVI